MYWDLIVPSNKIGCSKCEYTGFAFGKIPCECRDNVALIPEPEKEVVHVVSGCIPADYGMGYLTFNGTLRSKADKVYKVGEAIEVNGVVIGRALHNSNPDGTVDIAVCNVVQLGDFIYYQGLVRAHPKDLMIPMIDYSFVGDEIRDSNYVD
jgi:hypothetical protein